MQCCAKKDASKDAYSVKKAGLYFAVGLAIDAIPLCMQPPLLLYYWWAVAVFTAGVLVRHQRDYFQISRSWLFGVGAPLCVLVLGMHTTTQAAVWAPVVLVCTLAVSLRSALTDIENFWAAGRAKQAARYRQVTSGASSVLFGVCLHAVGLGWLSIGVGVWLGCDVRGQYLRRLLVKVCGCVGYATSIKRCLSVFPGEGECLVAKSDPGRSGGGTQGAFDALTLAMTVSWGFSVAKLLAVTLAGGVPGCYFFCDVWKTLGVWLGARASRQWVTRRAAQSVQGMAAEDLGSHYAAHDSWLRHGVLPVVLGASQLAALVWYSATLSVYKASEVLATVLIFACPCVVSLVEPSMFVVYAYVFGCDSKPDSVSRMQAFYKQQMRVVGLYYTVSIAMASGVTAAWTGFLMRPWHAACAMLVGQCAVLGNALRWVWAGQVGNWIQGWKQPKSALRASVLSKDAQNQVLDKPACCCVLEAGAQLAGAQEGVSKCGAR